jgi:hypothetical protein
MNALNPWALVVGAAMLGLPLAIHYLTRPKPKRFYFSAMKFLEGAIRQRRFFNRLRDIIILTMRALLIAAIALAFARPLIRGAATAPAEGTRRLVVLDISNSMHAHTRGIGVFQRARAKALQYVRYDPKLSANVLFAAARPRAAFDRFSSNFAALQSEIRTVELREEALNARAALAEAVRLFQQEGGAPGQLVLITDLQESNWRDVPAIELPKNVEIVVEHVGLDADAGNLSVSDAGPSGASRDGGPVVVRVDVENFSDAAQARSVRLEANGRPYTQEITCEPWGKSTAVFELPRESLLAGAAGGWVSGKAELMDANDSLPTDDVRHFAFEVMKPPTFALISRQSPALVGGSSYFLARMLCPAAGSGQAAESLISLDAGGLVPEQLANCDLLALVRPGRLTDEDMSLLSDLMLRGRPVLYVVSEAADVANLQQFETFCGRSLLMPVRFTVGSLALGERTVARTDDLYHLSNANLNRAPLDEFMNDPGALISEFQAARILKTTAVADTPQEDVLARWDDGSAALLMMSAGHGRLLIWNGDLEGSSLVRSPQFVALMRAGATRMLQESTPPPAAFACGTPCVVPLLNVMAQTEAVTVYDPDGNRVEDCVAGMVSNQLSIKWPRVGPPGVYTVKMGDKPVSSFAAACPPEESDLRPLTAEKVSGLLASGGPEASGNLRIYGLDGKDAPAEDREVWAWVMVAAIGCLILELSTLKLFRI